MSRVLSANVTSLIAGSAGVPCYLLEVDAENSSGAVTTFRWSSVAITLSPSFTEGRIAKKGLGKVRTRCDISAGGNLGEVSDWDFKLINPVTITTLYSDTLKDYAFVNRRAELRLIGKGIAGASWANAAQIFPGFVDDWDWDEEFIYFKCRSTWLGRHRDVPQRFMLLSQFASMKEELAGKPMPIVYGDYHIGPYNGPSIPWYNSTGGVILSARDYALGYLISQKKVLVAGHEVKTALAPASELEWLMKFEEEIAAYTYTESNYSAAHVDHTETFDGPTQTHQTDGGIGSYIEEFFVRLPYVSSYTDNTVLLPSACCDEDETNRTTLPQTKSITVKFKPIKLRNPFSWSGIYVWVSRAVAGGVSYSITYDGLVTPVTGYLLWFGAQVNVISPAGWPADVYGKEITLTLTAYYGSGGGDCYVDSICQMFTWTPSEGNVLENGETYLPIQGRMYKGWIDAASHSASTKNAGDVIINPAGIIESLLVDECYLTPGGSCRGLSVNSASYSAGFRVPHSDLLAITGDMTITLWLYLHVLPGAEGTIFFKGGSSATNVPRPWAVVVDTAGKFGFRCGNGTTGATVWSTSNVTTGKWVHIGITKKSNGDVVLYLDGAPDNSGSLGGSYPCTDAGEELWTFRSPYGFSLRCALDEVAIYNGLVMTEEDVSADYCGGFGVYKRQSYNLVALYHLDENYGRQIVDWSGSQNHGYTVSYSGAYWPAWVVGAVTSPSDIVESYFDAVEVARSALTAATEILEPINTRELIRSLCYEYLLAQYQRFDGREALSRVEPETVVAAYITNTDVATEARSRKSSLVIKRGKLVDVSTEFVLHYRKRYGGDECGRILYVMHPDAGVYSSSFTNLASGGSTYWAKCSAMYRKTLQVKRWEYTAEHIRDDATAEWFLKAMVDLLCRRPISCAWDSSLSLLALEVMDQVRVNHTFLPSAMRGHKQRLTEIVHDPSTSRLSFVTTDVEG